MRRHILNVLSSLMMRSKLSLRLVAVLKRNAEQVVEIGQEALMTVLEEIS